MRLKEEIEFVIDLIEFRKSKNKSLNIQDIISSANISKETIAMLTNVSKFANLFDNAEDKINTIKKLNVNSYVTKLAERKCFVEERLVGGDGCHGGHYVYVCSNSRYCDRRDCAANRKSLL